MKRIAVIFSVAGALALSALVLGRRAEPTIVTKPPVTPVIHVDPVATPQPVVSSAGSIIVTSKLSDPLLALGGDRDEYLKVDLTGVAVDGKRAPVNLAVVLDRSGSMAGEKIESARRAAHALVDRLGDADRLAFITFGSNVTPLFPSQRCTPAAKGEMHRAIDRIYDMGGTNLSGGLEAGLREVMAHGEGYAVNRVILISDGEANEGITSRTGLDAIARGALRQHVSVTALGVGADFDEDTMEQLAENGGGNYRFLQVGGELETVFNDELKQLSTTVAASPALHLQLAPGVRVAEVFGWTYDTEPGGIVIHMPDFAAGEHRKLVVQLAAPANQLGGERLVSGRLDYTDLLHGRAPVQTAWNNDASVVANQAQASLERDRETYAQVARVQAAHAARRAATLYSSGYVDQAEQELAKGRAQALQFNTIAKDDKLGADLDQIAPSAPMPAPASEAGKFEAKKMKQQAYDTER